MPIISITRWNIIFAESFAVRTIFFYRISNSISIHYLFGNNAGRGLNELAGTTCMQGMESRIIESNKL